MLRREDKLILLNSLSASTITQVGGNCSGVVEIAGYGQIKAAEVNDCYFKCAQNGRAKVVNVTVVIPSSCECPYEWGLTIVNYPSNELGSRYEVNNTFNVPRYYNYIDPAGGTPTATATAAAIAAQINADAAFIADGRPLSNCTAQAFGAMIVLTASNPAYGFDAYSPSASINIANPGQRPILTALEMAKLFPIQPGQFGAQPQLPNPALIYCEYGFDIFTKIQSVNGANHFNDYHQLVKFYVPYNVPNYFQMWHNPMVCNFPCLIAGSGISGHIS